MISRNYRFHGHNALNHLFRRGQTVRGSVMSLRYVANHRSDYRLAIVVSKKVSKSAVVRNRIRRRIYEIVRNNKKQTGTNWPYDISITVYDERIAIMPHKELVATVDGLFKKAKLH